MGLQKTDCVRPQDRRTSDAIDGRLRRAPGQVAEAAGEYRAMREVSDP